MIATMKAWNNLAQQFQPLLATIGLLQGQSGGVADRAAPGCDQAGADRVPPAANTIGMTEVACFAAGGGHAMGDNDIRP